MLSLVLYSTTGCHLCEKAEDLLKIAEQHLELEWRCVDIVDSEELMARYALRIPVLCDSKSGEELGWPFDEWDLKEWLCGIVQRGS